MSETINPDAGDWKPQVQLDIHKASNAQFVEATETFEKYRETLGELPPLNMSNDWYKITPQWAEELVCRNVKGANRKLTFSHVRYCAEMQLAGDWVKTPQAIGFSEGILVDGQHRLWGCYLGGASFNSYVIFDVPPQKRLFAYLDNGKVRNAATALATAGYDGLSPFVNGIVQIRNNVKFNAYSMQKVAKLPKLSPIQVLRLVDGDTLFKKAAHTTAAEYGSAVEKIGHKDIAGYVSYEILAKHDEFVLEEFMVDLGSRDEDLQEGSPVLALHRFLEANQKSAKPLGKHIVLAHVIRAFNAWKAGESLKRIRIPVDDTFPVLVSGDAPEPESEE